MSRHRGDALLAARNYQALFRGEEGLAADVAGMRLSECVELLIAYVRAHEKR